MQWVVRSSESLDVSAMQDLAAQLEISPALVKILWGRGIKNTQDMQYFLNPSLQYLLPLASWEGLTEAGHLLATAIMNGNKIGIWGDYDVDGITATALLSDFLRFHGTDACNYIPNRLHEGYGMTPQGIDVLHEQGVQTLITVDSGITDVEAVAYAKSLGLQVIITDHHLPGESLPAADCILNPRLPGCPCPTLAGVGVAFFLVAAANVALEGMGRTKMDIRLLLDLVALGTLADVVDLQGQNRILVKNGLLVLGSGNRVGLAALKSACNIAPAAWLGASQVVFTLAPRLNAAGRLGSSKVALDLLLTADRVQANVLAQELSRMNAERRDEEDRILVEAQKQAEQQVAEAAEGIVVYEPHWHPGIIGIVASRLVEQLHRPCVVLCEAEGCLKGSARSITGFDIHAAFGECAPYLLSYGGHKMAAGLSLLQENLQDFREGFSQVVKRFLNESVVESICKLDAPLSFKEAAEFTFLKELEMLQPFGMGNAEPVFFSPPVRIKNMRARPNFMQLELEDEESGVVLQAKAWRELANIPLQLKGQHICIAYTPRIDRYSGVASVELRLKDWKLPEETPRLS